jgi:hypothetical protein
MLKKISLATVILIFIAAASLYIFRHAIIRHYVEKAIRENPPSYIKIDDIRFDFALNKVSFTGFTVANPKGFPSEYLVRIKDASCLYVIFGGVIPRGIEIRDVVLNGADVRIDRLRNSRMNVAASGNLINSPAPQHAVKEARQERPVKGVVKMPDILKLPNSFKIKSSQAVFCDMSLYRDPYVLYVGHLNGHVNVVLTDDYTALTSISWDLSGLLNDRKDQMIHWVASLDPTKKALTMSNRFDVEGLDIVPLGPYYDSFSPFVFKRGVFSGNLVFDFADGRIGSTNEIRLSNLAFYVKEGRQNSEMWDANVEDLLRYFTTPSGEVVFDFKLKGDMYHPTPYLGPISKRALTSMAMKKLTDYAVNSMTNQKDNGASSNIDQAIDAFKKLIKK